MEIVYFSRKPTSLGYSIEELFQTVQQALPAEFVIKNVTLPYTSGGLVSGLLNMWFAYRRKGSINHITGDVHYLALVLPRRRTVLTIHDCGELKKLWGVKKLLLWLFWFRLPISRLQYVTAISAETKNELMKHVKASAEKISVIHNCLIGTYTRKQSYNWDTPRILQVGVTVNKNVPRILRALTGIRCTLVVLGSPGEDELRMIAQAGTPFEVHSRLSRQQVQKLYESCDILLYPSTLEGFGLPIIEAQACGLPVITSNVSAMPEIAGKAAAFVNPYDPADIRSALLRVISDKNFRDLLIKGGFQNIQRFAPATISKQYLELYKTMSNG